MDKAESTGIGVALAGHVAILAALSLGLADPPDLPKLANDPVEVELVSEVAPVSTAPVPSNDSPAPAPAPAPEPQPVVAPVPLPPPPAPVIQPRPTPKPAAKPVARPAPSPKPAAAKPPPQRATKPVQTARAEDERGRRRPDRPGLSRDLVSGLRDAPAARPSPTPGRGTATSPPAQKAGPAVEASLGAEIRRQVKPHWKSPTGADVELLRTTIAVNLNRDGSLADAPTLASQSGVNESNRAQARLHVDQAIKAVRLAAPFKLPAEYYDAWRSFTTNFDKRLSQ